MSEAELPQDPAQLQALVRQQAEELKKIKQLNANLTEKSEGLSVSVRVNLFKFCPARIYIYVNFLQLASYTYF